MNDKERGARFWNLMIRSVEAEPRPVQVLRGATGFEHRSLAVGVDEKRRRLVFVSGEHDARASAIAQADIQAANPTFQVIAARPLAMDLSVVARLLERAAGGPEIRIDDLQAQLDKGESGELMSAFQVFGDAFKAAPVNTLSQWMHAVHQLSLLDAIPATPPAEAGGVGLPLRFDVKRLVGSDPFAADRELGICPIPLYRFVPGEVEVFQTDQDTEAGKEILRKHGLLQYFLPPPDHLSLGLVEHGTLSRDALIRSVEKVPALGHPFATSELALGARSVSEVISALQDQKLLVDGEVGLELTDTGRTLRAEVRFKPRESLFTRILKRFSVDVSLSDIFRGGPQ